MNELLCLLFLNKNMVFDLIEIFANMIYLLLLTCFLLLSFFVSGKEAIILIIFPVLMWSIFLMKRYIWQEVEKILDENEKILLRKD